MLKFKKLKMLSAVLMVLFLFTACGSNSDSTNDAADNEEQETAVESSEADSSTVKLAIGEWPPYTSESIETAKMAEEVVTAAFNAVGMKVEYSYYPWKRSYTLTEKGESDGTFPWNKTEERAKLFKLNNEPIATDRNIFVHLKGSDFSYSKIEDLKKYKMGAMRGYKQVELYKKHNISTEVVENEEQCIKMLIAGRLEAFEASENVINYILKNKFSEEDRAKVEIYSKAAGQDQFYVLFANSERGNNFVKEFNKGFAKIKNNGRYDAIMKKYK